MSMKRPSRRSVAAGAVVVAVAAGGATLWTRSGASASAQYRTAVATLGTVTQTLNLSGNLSPVGSTTLNFGSSGKVTAVDVQPGQSVKPGEVLATIDPTTLQATLTQAQATLSSAQARLALDQGGPTAQNLAQSQASVRSAQAQLQSAQTSLTDTKAVNQQAVAAAQATLAADENKPACPTSTPTPAPSPSPRSGTGSGTSSSCNPPGQIQADQQAVTAAQAKAQQGDDQAQNQVNSAQVGLQNAQAALAALQQGTTAQQLQIDQSQVQIDQIDVTNAQNALAQATLTSPVDGVVGEVNITVGQTATGGGSGASSSGGSGSGSGGSGGGGSGGGAGSGGAGTGPSSSTPDIVILDPGAFEVVGSVSDSQINEVAVGQAAKVTVAGNSRPIDGKVTGIAPEATVSSGVASFPVTVVLDGSNPSLHSGVSASIAVVVNQVSQVLTVPTSAVRPSGGTDSVQVLVNGQPQTRPVTVGAVDALRTQILSGVNEGDSVVIATVTSVVPTPNASGFVGGGGRGAGNGSRAIGRALGG